MDLSSTLCRSASTVVSVCDFPGYLIDQSGKLVNKKSKREIRGFTDSRLRRRVKLTDPAGFRRSVTVHLLIWRSFVGEVPKGFKLESKVHMFEAGLADLELVKVRKDSLTAEEMEQLELIKSWRSQGVSVVAISSRLLIKPARVYQLIRWDSRPAD